MSQDVFISYSTLNRPIADRLAEDLARSGLRVFYDKDLVPGEAWASRLEQQLRRAKYILVLLSPAYLSSQWARRELELAALSESEGAARIIPVLIENTEIPVFLRARHYADLRYDYKEGLAQIRKALATKPEVPEVSRARRSRRAVDIVSVLASLLGAAAASVSMADLVGHSQTTILVAGVAVALTALIAVLSSRHPSRRSKPLQVLTEEIEQAYVDALDRSHLNPLAPQGTPNA